MAQKRDTFVELTVIKFFNLSLVLLFFKDTEEAFPLMHSTIWFLYTVYNVLELVMLMKIDKACLQKEKIRGGEAETVFTLKWHIQT